jgi:hypothetical protein
MSWYEPEDPELALWCLMLINALAALIFFGLAYMEGR